jgi:hypothetical protein
MSPFKMYSGDQSKSLPTIAEMDEAVKRASIGMGHIADASVIMGSGGSSGVYTSTTTERRISSDPYGQVTITSDLHRMRMIMMRLRITEASTIPFQHISTGLGGDHVFVFIVKGGEPITLRDDVALFPSDTLITQLRLLMP